MHALAQLLVLALSCGVFVYDALIYLLYSGIYSPASTPNTTGSILWSTPFLYSPYSSPSCPSCTAWGSLGLISTDKAEEDTSFLKSPWTAESTKSIRPPLIWICGCLVHDSAERHSKWSLLGILPWYQTPGKRYSTPYREDKRKVYCSDSVALLWVTGFPEILIKREYYVELTSILNGTGVRGEKTVFVRISHTILHPLAHWGSHQSYFVRNDTPLYLFSFTPPEGFCA